MAVNVKHIAPLAGAIVCSFGFVTALAQTAEPVSVERTQKISATVKSVDHENRLVELTADGETTTIQVPDEVRNLDRVKAGDEVVVTYHEALAAAFKKKGESQTVGVVDSTVSTSRMPKGSQPGAGLANQVTTTVIIEGVDRSANEVTFTGPAGMTRTVEVKDPKAQQFVGTLKKGDEVEITYTEALAVTVEPGRAK
jgi:hypothetical protein